MSAILLCALHSGKATDTLGVQTPFMDLCKTEKIQ